jgi:thiol-disulfide isomerase/thioredoxin
VKRIDERGVWFESSQYEATFVPHERIKAVDLENVSRDTKVNPTKRDRLLTLPRVRRDNPPKHLIRSVDGDYLRANVVSLDEKTLTVEVRLEERHLPRSNIARIIWLHEGDAEHEKTAATQMRVQSLGHDSNRVTVLFEKLTDATLIGTSDTMGRCRINLKDVDELFFGTMSELTVKDLPYQRWKLRAAQDPKFAQSGESEGKESTLVAKMAPDFTLEKLDGTPFRLQEQRGKVVVLDFWATWCGACVQVLPEIDHLVDRLNNKDVVLVAVNLQETPKAIQATLDRLKVKPTVVLDQNGAVAAKYAAVAIPQTVIIDRSGRIARVFVGGGPQYIEHVQESLQKILAEGNGHAASN